MAQSANDPLLRDVAGRLERCDGPEDDVVVCLGALPASADGSVQFAFMSDIQTPTNNDPTPNAAPSSITSTTGPYTAIPRLSISRSAVRSRHSAIKES